MRIQRDVTLKDDTKCDGCPFLVMIGAGALMCVNDYPIEHSSGHHMIVWKREDATRPQRCIDEFGK